MMKWGLGLAGLAVAGVIALVAAGGVGGAVSAQVAGNGEERGERYRELLAGELGVTVEELEAAQKTARDTLIDEAVAAGDVSAERGVELKALEAGERLRFGIGKHIEGHRLARAVFNVFEKVADGLGMEIGELRDRIAGGESVNEIAAAEGVDVEGLKTDVIDQITERVNQAVEDSGPAQDRADMILEGLEEKVDRAFEAEGSSERPRGFRPFRGFDGFGPGFRN